MSTIPLSIRGLFVVMAVLMFAATAQAQATRTWVSGVGDDANPCSRTAPCKTFAGAISKTAAGGEINCLDQGGYGGVTITKSMTIKCEGVVAGVLVSGTNAIIINAGVNDIITLSGLDLEGLGTGLNGINFLAGSALHVHKCQIRNFRGANGTGILFQPSSGTSELYVADSYITDNGSNSTSGGIVVKMPASSTSSAVVSISNTYIENNNVGIRIDTTNTTGTIKGLVRNSLVAGSTNNAITAVGNATLSQLTVDHTGVVGNTFGLVVNGLQATLVATNTTVTANGTGLFVNGTGALVTYRTNSVFNNTTDGAFTVTRTPPE